MPSADATSLPAFAGDAAEAVQDAQALGGDGPRVASATDLIPATWVAALGADGDVSVPGAFSRSALERSGVDPGRLRVDAPVLGAGFPLDVPARRPDDASGFVFLAVSDWTRAGGWDVLVRAYAEEFGADEDVSLVILAWSSLGYTPAVIGETLVAELEAAGHDVDDVADIILEVATEHRHPDAGHYRGADCYVSPARGDAWGRRLLEAAACGIPVIATAWAAGADVGCTYPLGATVVDVDAQAARELPHLAGGRWAEPDGGELRRHLRAVFEGRTPSPPAAVAVAKQRAVSPSRAGARPQDVSFVLQGPVERFGRASTVRACAAIRAHFPGAEIVVSTWEGANPRGVDCDVLVESADPGSVGGSTYNPNTNRQIVGSLAGVRAATRPLVVKARSDLQFLSPALLSHWRRWEERTDELKLFEHRVLVPNVFTRRPSHLAPFALHPSDWAYFGTRADLELLFDVPHMTRDSSVVDRVEPGSVAHEYWWRDHAPSHTPEQWLWCQALRKVHPELAISSVFDLTPETLRLTEVSFANNLAILDTYVQYGAWSPKYPWPNRLYEDHTLYQHEQWLELYARHCGAGPVAGAGAEAVLERLAHGGPATLAEADVLRRAGFSYEAQLLECVLVGHRFRRDSTTGGSHRWLHDIDATKLAGRELAASAAAALQRSDRPSAVVA